MITFLGNTTLFAGAAMLDVGELLIALEAVLILTIIAWKEDVIKNCNALHGVFLLSLVRR